MTPLLFIFFKWRHFVVKKKATFFTVNTRESGIHNDSHTLGSSTVVWESI